MPQKALLVEHTALSRPQQQSVDRSVFDCWESGLRSRRSSVLPQSMASELGLSSDVQTEQPVVRRGPSESAFNGRRYTNTIKHLIECRAPWHAYNQDSTQHYKYHKKWHKFLNYRNMRELTLQLYRDMNLSLHTVRGHFRREIECLHTVPELERSAD